MTTRLLPPAGGGNTTINGRLYSAAAGVPVDAPDFDAAKLEANGWTVVSIGGSGATAARPTKPTKGLHFLDTTLGKDITFDGLVWRDKATGSTV